MTTYKNATEALPGLLSKVLSEGDTVESRNGTTRELTMQQVTLTDPWPLEITTPGRKVSLPAQIAETMWLLAGRNDVEWLSHYLPRAKEFSDDGKTWRGGYGPRIRRWESSDGWQHLDQLAHVVDLIKADPQTRRAVLNIYNPSIDMEPGKDIPCNNWVHLLPRDGKLHAHVAIRSNDLFWGWSGINSFEWSALLTIVAGLTGLQRGSITFSISSLHLYDKHWERAANISNSWDPAADNSFPRPNPDFTVSWEANDIASFDFIVKRWFEVEKLIRTDAAEADVIQAINDFPEPMLASWLWVLYAWHNGDMDILSMMGFEGSSLYAAAEASPARKKPAPPVPEDRDGFTLFVNNLHQEKNAAYGNSWMKRGEMLGIMANCARKVDRLGVGGAGDTAADTAIDLMVYFIKYDLWLEQQKHSDWQITEGQPHIDAVYNYLEVLAGEKYSAKTNEKLIDTIKVKFDELEHLVTEKVYDRDLAVKQLIGLTYPLALRLWTAEQATPVVGHAERNATRSWNPEA